MMMMMMMILSHGYGAYKLGLVMGRHIDIIEIYRHRFRVTQLRVALPGGVVIEQVCWSVGSFTALFVISRKIKVRFLWNSAQMLSICDKRWNSRTTPPQWGPSSCHIWRERALDRFCGDLLNKEKKTDVKHGSVLVCLFHRCRRRGHGGHVPPKIREQICFGQLLCKIRAFSGNNHVKFGNFVNFFSKYHKNSGILLIFGHKSCKIRAFC